MLSWVFAYVYVMTTGGPGNSTVVTEFYIYQKVFFEQQHRHRRGGRGVAAGARGGADRRRGSGRCGASTRRPYEPPRSDGVHVLRRPRYAHHLVLLMLVGARAVPDLLHGRQRLQDRRRLPDQPVRAALAGHVRHAHRGPPRRRVLHLAEELVPAHDARGGLLDRDRRARRLPHRPDALAAGRLAADADDRADGRAADRADHPALPDDGRARPAQHVPRGRVRATSACCCRSRPSCWRRSSARCRAR